MLHQLRAAKVQHIGMYLSADQLTAQRISPLLRLSQRPCCLCASYLAVVAHLEPGQEHPLVDGNSVRRKIFCVTEAHRLHHIANQP